MNNEIHHTGLIDWLAGHIQTIGIAATVISTIVSIIGIFTSTQAIPSLQANDTDGVAIANTGQGKISLNDNSIINIQTADSNVYINNDHTPTPTQDTAALPDYSSMSTVDRIVYSSDLIKQGRYDSAEDLLTKTISDTTLTDSTAGEQMSALYYNRGLARFFLGMYGLAQRDFETVNSYAQRADAYYNLGLIALQQADYDLALDNFDRALEISNSEVYSSARQQAILMRDAAGAGEPVVSSPVTAVG